MHQAGIPLDTPLGEHQRGHRMNKIFPVHGGNRREGTPICRSQQPEAATRLKRLFSRVATPHRRRRACRKRDTTWSTGPALS